MNDHVWPWTWITCVFKRKIPSLNWELDLTPHTSSHRPWISIDLPPWHCQIITTNTGTGETVNIKQQPPQLDYNNEIDRSLSPLLIVPPITLEISHSTPFDLFPFQSSFCLFFLLFKITIMSSLTTTWSPSSFQLRLAFTAPARKKSLTPSPAFLRMRIRMLSVSENWPKNNGPERRRSGDSSWALNPNSTSDGYAGWTNAEQSTHSNSSPSPNSEILYFL